MEYITLSNGVKMPTLGYGVFLVSPDECELCVSDALSVGYRLIDTAQAYQILLRKWWQRYMATVHGTSRTGSHSSSTIR